MKVLILTLSVILVNNCVTASDWKGLICSSIALTKTESFTEVQIDDIKIELPVIETESYKRKAPVNYSAGIPTKSVAIPCPYHGYRCGMHKYVEDLMGHLQSVHNKSLEELNSMDRETLKDYHDDLHYVNKEKSVASNCPNGKCPTTKYYYNGKTYSWQ